MYLPCRLPLRLPSYYRAIHPSCCKTNLTVEQTRAGTGMSDQGGIRNHVAKKDVTGKEVTGKEEMARQEKMAHHPRAWNVSGLPSDTTMA